MYIYNYICIYIYIYIYYSFLFINDSEVFLYVESSAWKATADTDYTRPLPNEAQPSLEEHRIQQGSTVDGCRIRITS